MKPTTSVSAQSRPDARKRKSVAGVMLKDVAAVALAMWNHEEMFMVRNLLIPFISGIYLLILTLLLRSRQIEYASGWHTAAMYAAGLSFLLEPATRASLAWYRSAKRRADTN